MTGVRVGGQTRTLEVRELRGGALFLHAQPARPGVAVAWVASRPRTIDLKPDEVRHYLEEIGALETVGREWESGGRSPWRETYVKLAKAYVRVGEPVSDTSWSDPVGLPLELVPEADPTRLRNGDALTLRLLWQGRPLSGLAVGAVPSGAAAVLRPTDEDGRVTVALDRAGPWLLRATRVRRAEPPDTGWQSHFMTVTLNVTE